jgi:beta-glucanase (GH16 family)
MVHRFVVSWRWFGWVISPLAVGALVVGMLGGGAGMAWGQTLSLVWSDEFNGASIDLTKWTFDIGNGGWGNNELEYYTSSSTNAYVTNGFLHIRAQIQSINGSSYTSARMKTQGLYWKTYGRIEWRAKLPAGTGFWPALWMLGTNINSIGWPGCGEIDVVENNGATITFEQGSIHSGSDATKIFNFTGGNSVTNFHVYDLDWTNNSITWSVDGVAYETQTSWSSSTGEPYPFPFNQPFFFLMNLAVGGNYLGNPSTNSINPNMPGEMVIDYIRVYDYIASTNPPATPTGLTASPGGASVALNWNASSGAANYNVKRATVSGGSYTTIASPTATSYTDTGLVNCATYYYVVSGTNSYGESSNSTEAAASLGPYYFAVNSGGSAAGTFVADTNFTGSANTESTAATIITTGVTNPAPQAVYQTARWGQFMYTFSGLTTGTSYTVRLHFAEIYWNAAGKREFNVFINGTQVLTNLDIWATTGGEDIAMIRQYIVTPKTNGQISITYSNGAADQAKSSGIEIILPAPAAPTGLTATGTVGQVTLNWNAVPGATGYNVKRSTVSGGPYTNVANGVTSTTDTDTNVTNGTPYYYVVSSLKNGCEGANSAEVSATPSSVLTFAQWQTLYFGSTTNALAAPDVDADGTGQNNLFKYVAGLDPTNPASVFILTISGVANQPTQMNLLFTPMVAGRTYTPQFSTDLVSGVWMPLAGYLGPTISSNQVTITDTNPIPPQEFYHIEITYP